MAASGPVTPVITVPPNKSLLLVDSRYRNLDDTPYNLTVQLTAGLTGRRLTYQTLSWSSPFFTHNLTNNKIRLQFLRSDLGPEIVYVTYMMPWTITKQFANPDGSTNIAPGSYAAYLTASLNDLRLEVNNLAPTPLMVAGQPVEAVVVYDYGRGFTIYFQNTTTAEIEPFRILDCSWIENGHYIHGFGIYDVDTNKFRPPTYLLPKTDPSSYVSAYSSDTTPTLLYTRYVSISSRELTKDRIVQPFTSSGASNANLSAQLAIFATSYLNSGVYHQDYEVNDNSIINIREGTQPQYFHILIDDEFGNTLIPSNPLNGFFQDPNVPKSLYTDYFNPNINYQSHDLLNYLIFGKTSNDSIMNPSARAGGTSTPSHVEASFFYGLNSAKNLTVREAGQNQTKFIGVQLYNGGLGATINTLFYYGEWDTTGLSDIIPILGTKATKVSTFVDPSTISKGEWTMKPQGSKVYNVTLHWNNVQFSASNAAFDVADAYILNLTFRLEYLDVDSKLISSVQIGDTRTASFYGGNGHSYTVNFPASYQLNVITPPGTYRIEPYFTVNLITNVSTDSYFQASVYLSEIVMDAAVIAKQDNPFVIPIPEEDYPYGKYNATCLEDDLLHQMEIVTTF